MRHLSKLVESCEQLRVAKRDVHPLLQPRLQREEAAAQSLQAESASSSSSSHGSKSSKKTGTSKVASKKTAAKPSPAKPPPAKPPLAKDPPAKAPATTASTSTAPSSPSTMPGATVRSAAEVENLDLLLQKSTMHFTADEKEHALWAFYCSEGRKMTPNCIINYLLDERQFQERKRKSRSATRNSARQLTYESVKRWEDRALAQQRKQKEIEEQQAEQEKEEEEEQEEEQEEEGQEQATKDDSS